jgi:selenocysteine-specific elongation factor
MAVIATAGHVDHGKSSLVLALTGTDPDRFAEEKRRGMTIDLGFAHTVLPDGTEISFVDVPGHVRFLRNMLAGVGGVNCCVFVVAATEGWKPQSEEHLRILEILGLHTGIIALTKVDLVDDDLRELATLEITERVAGTFLEGAPILPVAAPSGIGITDVQIALAEMVRRVAAPADLKRPRLWVDRVFAAKGSGTVVTGTLTHGSLRTDQQVVIEPGGRTARIRSIQTHGAQVDQIGPGHRVALNLAGIGHEEMSRGDVVVLPDTWWLSSRVDARLDVIPALAHSVSRRGAHLAYIGSRELPIRLRVLGPDAIPPGHSQAIRLHLPVAVPVMPGDRFVIRESGRDETVGGGEILDVAPVLPASRARPDRDLARMLAERGWVTVDQWRLLTGDSPVDAHRVDAYRVDAYRVVGEWVVDPQVLEAVVEQLHELVSIAGPLGYDTAGLDERQRAVLETLSDVRTEAGRAFLVAAADPLADHPYLEWLRSGGLAPDAVIDADRGVLRELARRGQLWERDGLWFHVEAITTAISHVRALLAADPSGFTVSQFREHAGLTRKHAVPLLSELDARAITRRREDLRIAGPRMPPD